MCLVYIVQALDKGTLGPASYVVLYASERC
jgi:hypothetical protein